MTWMGNTIRHKWVKFVDTQIESNELFVSVNKLGPEMKYFCLMLVPDGHKCQLLIICVLRDWVWV